MEAIEGSRPEGKWPGRPIGRPPRVIPDSFRSIIRYGERKLTVTGFAKILDVVRSKL
jgi:hypothetical protein